MGLSANRAASAIGMGSQPQIPSQQAQFPAPRYRAEIITRHFPGHMMPQQAQVMPNPEPIPQALPQLPQAPQMSPEEQRLRSFFARMG